MSTGSLSGQTLGKYQLRDLLGQGGMGAVYSAFQVDLEREVAVKVLSASLILQPGYLDRFNREARTSAALEHRHIVPIYDYGVQGDISYVVMRRLSGGTLADRLEGGALPALNEVARLLRELASALDYAHSKGVIHRDIKPSNVMFDSQGSAYLVDFGIAKLMDATALTSSGISAMGTPAFMSPEQWRGADVSPASDQYALGILAYILVTGRLPFEADTPYAMMYKHLGEQPTPPQAWRAGLPKPVAAAIQRALAKTPGERFPTLSAFAEAFERAIASVKNESTGFFSAPVSQTRTRQSGSSQPVVLSPREPTRRSPLVWAAALVLVLGLGAAAFAAAQLAQPTPTAVVAASTVTVSDTPATVSSASATPEAVVVLVAPTEPPTAVLPPTQATSVPTDQPTDAPVPTHTASPEPIAQIEIVASETHTQSPVPTDTRTATATSTVTTMLIPTLTNTVMPSRTSTATPTATNPPTDTPTSTPTPTPTATRTPTPTATLTPTVTFTPSATPLAAVFSNADWSPMTRSFNGSDMVLVPPGCFQMGSSPAQLEAAFLQCESELGAGRCQRVWFEKEAPQTNICFTEPFWMDRTEVTNQQFGGASDAFASTAPERPREEVNWADAAAHCASRAARLPTEAEWEYAARGPDGLLYPWGNDFVADNSVYDSNSGQQTQPVGSRPGGASWVGAYDMSGNLREWVSTLFRPYPYSATDGRESTADTTSDRVVRGGSWFVIPVSLRTADRINLNPSIEDWNIGFRCVRDYLTSDLEASG